MGLQAQELEKVAQERAGVKAGDVILQFNGTPLGKAYACQFVLADGE